MKSERQNFAQKNTVAKKSHLPEKLQSNLPSSPEEESSLLLSLIRSVSISVDLDSAMQLVLQKLCETTGWDFGEAWIPNQEENFLELSPAWFTHHPDLEQLSLLKQFRIVSQSYVFRESQGLPGHIWASQGAKWITDASVNSGFLRNELARQYGLKAAVGIPIISDNLVVAILIFFMCRVHTHDQHFVELVSTLAVQLGDLFKRKQIETKLQESQRQLHSLINSIPGIFYRTNAQEGFPITYVSEGFRRLTGYSPKELLMQRSVSFSDITHPQDVPIAKKSIETAIKNNSSYIFEYRILTKTGDEKWLWEKGKGIYNENEDLIGLEGFISDITERKHAEQEIKSAEAKYRNIYEHCLCGIFQTRPDGHYLSANPALAKIYGYDSPEDLIQSLTDIGSQLYVNPQKRTEFIELLQKNGTLVDFVSEVYHRSGKTLWISENARSVYDANGNLLYYEGMVEDITYRVESEKALATIAYFDPLTKLPNRSLFIKRLSEAIANFQADKTYTFGVLFLDIDRMKVVNDSFGHKIGDKLLIMIARILEHCINEGHTVARIGGDEFTILLDNITSQKDIFSTIERIKQELKIIFYIGSYKISSGISIGVVDGRQYSDYISLLDIELNPEKILQDASLACDYAKSLGRGTYQVFNINMQNDALEIQALETSLRQAINNHEFLLYYQPIVNIATRKISGFESLVRWLSPEQGLILPDKFIAIAEDSGLIIPLGLWILRESCHQLKRWHHQFPQLPLTINVNLSLRQLAQPDFLDQIDTILVETDLNPCYLKLEITESFCINSHLNSVKILQALRQRSIQLCIDDFGTGYSSLHYLHQLPINVVKIDRSFIEEIDTDSAIAKVAKTIFSLAKDLGLTTVAEGIETQQQFDKLRSLDCEFGQGYFFSKPMTATAIEALLSHYKRLIELRI